MLTSCMYHKQGCLRVIALENYFHQLKTVLCDPQQKDINFTLDPVFPLQNGYTFEMLVLKQVQDYQ